MKALITCCCFIALIGLGYIVNRFTPIGEKLRKAVTFLVMWIALPCAVISGYSGFAIDKTVLPMAAVCFVSGAVQLFFGSRLGDTPEEHAQGMITLTGYNTGCFAIPFAQAFFGPSGVVATCIFDAMNVVFCCGGSYAVASGKYLSAGKKGKLGAVLKSMFSSHIFIIYMVMLVLNALKVSLPAVVVKTADVLSKPTGYLAMFMIGLGINPLIKKDSLVKHKRALEFRYLIAAALSLLIVVIPGFLSGYKAAAVLNLLAPITILAPEFYRKCDGKGEDISLIITISSVLSVILMSALSICCMMLNLQ